MESFPLAQNSLGESCPEEKPELQEHGGWSGQLGLREAVSQQTLQRGRISEGEHARTGTLDLSHFFLFLSPWIKTEVPAPNQDTSVEDRVGDSFLACAWPSAHCLPPSGTRQPVVSVKPLHHQQHLQTISLHWPRHWEPAVLSETS